MRRTLLVPAALIVALAAGCAPTPVTAPTATPSETAAPSSTPTPTAEPIALPDCDTIYSDAVVASLTGEGRSPLGDVSGPGMGGWGTADDNIEAILSAIPERVSCTWVLPATESGSTTSIARLDEATRTTLIDAFTAAGYVVDGTLFEIEVDSEIGSYNETHILADGFWVGSYFSGGDSATLTGDALAQLLP
ncbi:hypothetical protein [Microcella humidisoli]|uniref:Lipoprotein n=1 Tax=Microcella humidisoli TaxID=2963406 RepID=A0ABY5FX31_9MICO|nr:hypothetical protein [Microcella humidisoli]UTT62689.1 hypothetical protein NNL39_00785 [Microcella humidisoli]